MGAPGSGKSSTLCSLLDSDDGARRFVYDPGEDYCSYGEVFTSVKAVQSRMLAAGEGGFKIVFLPSSDLDCAKLQFDVLCKLAYAAGNVLAVVDELEDVVTPSWAPPGWRLLVRKGRKRGVRIVAASQRPAGIEKRIWSMATVIRSGRLNDEDDVRTIARVLMVHPHEVLALEPLHWIQRSVYLRAIMRGHIVFKRGHPFDVLDSEQIISFPAARPMDTSPLGR